MSNNPLDENQCEYDCKNICDGCGESFCEEKIRHELPHDKELPEAHYLDNGEKYCGIDCYRDSH